jgi:hypothetical protein
MALTIYSKGYTDGMTEFPDVPDGMFFRVSEEVRRNYWGDLISEGLAVKLASVTPERQEVREIYGEHWWNKNVHLGRKNVTIPEKESVHGIRYFKDRLYTVDRSDIPRFVKDITHRTYDDDELNLPDEYDYLIPISDEGVAFLAWCIWVSYLSQLEFDALEEDRIKKEKEAKERLIGDYPPKTLGKA